MKQKTKILLGLFLFEICMLLPMFLNKPVLGHDMNFHLANIDLLSHNLTWDMWKQGFHIMPSITSNLGYGIGIFYPILPHLFCALINRFYMIFNLPILYSLYTTYFIIAYGSSILVYQIAKQIHKNDVVAFFSAIIYTTMPYFLSNFFIRFALNEIFFFFFFLMVVLGLFYFIETQDRKFYCFFILGYIGMISSHLTLSLFGSFFLIFFAIIYYKEIFKKDRIKKILIAILIVSIWVLPDIVLLLIHQLDGRYIVFLENSMTSLSLVNGERLSIKDLLFRMDQYNWEVAFFLPITILFLCFISGIYILKNKLKEEKKKIYFFIVLGITSIYMISELFPWQVMPKFTWMIQFPWRLEGFMIFAIAILSPLWMLHFKRNNDLNKVSIVLLLSIVISLLPFLSLLRNRVYLFHGYNLDEAMGHQHEYLPSDLNTDLVLDDIVSQNCHVKIIKNQADQLIFQVTDLTDKETLVLPKLFYYGYQLKDQNKKQYPLKRSDSGYLEVTLQKDGIYFLQYTGTKSYQILRMIRISMVFIFIIYTMIYFKRK